MPSPKKHLGQHFLCDSNILNSLVKLISPKFSEHLVEIGPGAGALAALLLPLVSSLDVIEFDRDIITTLKSSCGNSTKLHVWLADVLQFDFTRFQAPIRLIGNLPYNISTPILFKAIENITLLTDMHFMLQKEVADRIVASPGSKTYGRLSVMLQYYCEVEILLNVKPKSFCPPPKVNSAFIRLLPRKQHSVIAHNELLFSEVVRVAFCYRRKTILNGLRKYITEVQLKKINIDPKSRPEQLTVDEFVRISNLISGVTSLSYNFGH